MPRLRIVVALVFAEMSSYRPEVFSDRMVELGLESCLAQAKSLNIDTLAKFAFGCDYTPQHPKTELL